MMIAPQGEASDAQSVRRVGGSHTDDALGELARIDDSNRLVATHADKASGVAASGLELAESASLTVEQLKNSANSITGVVELIEILAGNTHLLALNAKIEAARAGEAGSGFAVVAHEVKQLATQTTDATQKIGEQIEAIRTAAQQSVVAVEQILEVVSQVGTLQESIAGEIRQQDEMTRRMKASLAAIRESNA